MNLTQLTELSRNTFYDIFYNLKMKGNLVSPRGQKVLEVENYGFVFPPYVRFCSFEARKMNLNYIKQEFLWYLKGDRYDLSILEQASMWKTLVNKDGGINSNYGQYIFYPYLNSQFDKIIELLKDDKDSRRASIVILNKDHILSETNDLPCTYSLNFRIRNNKLNMTVRMRSNDLIFGLTNDAPTFSFTHEMIFVSLKQFYPDLELGEYYHSADSAHIYERHFNMLEQILDPNAKFLEVECPKINDHFEVKTLRSLNNASFQMLPEYKFINWLTDGQYCKN